MTQWDPLKCRGMCVDDTHASNSKLTQIKIFAFAENPPKWFGDCLTVEIILGIDLKPS